MPSSFLENEITLAVCRSTSNCLKRKTQQVGPQCCKIEHVLKYYFKEKSAIEIFVFEI